MSLLKLCTHTILLILHPLTLSKILPHSVRSSSHHYSARLLRSDMVQPPGRHSSPGLCRCSLSPAHVRSPPPAPSGLPSLLSASSSLWHFAAAPVHGSRAAGAASVLRGLLASSPILLLAWGASGLCSFLDISSRYCPFEMCNLSSQIPIEIHFIHLSMSWIKKPLERYLFLFFLILHSCWVSSPSAFCSISRFSLFNRWCHLCLSIHQSVPVLLLCFFLQSKIHGDILNFSY